MCVIPFIKGTTVVDKHEDYKNGTSILIKDFDISQFNDSTDSNVCYELRIGEKYRDLRESEPKTLNDDQEIIINPGEAVVIKTKEFIQLPESMFGYIIPKVSLLQLGISNTSSKIDPGYSGNLAITVFNLGKDKVSLKKNQRFCSLNIVRIEKHDGIKLYNKGPKDIKGLGKRNTFDKISDFSKKHDAPIKIILLFVPLIIKLLEFIFARYL